MARNLKECLTIQLREKDRLDPAMQTFIDNLELLARHDMARLKSLCKVDMEDLKDMVNEVRALNPKPGRADEELAQKIRDQATEETTRCFSCGLCFGCEQCAMFCTSGCFTRLEQPAPGLYFSLSLDACKECGKCIEVCPCGFLEVS